jgi:alpha-tubulin suppressor-like RCC1 family protein
LGWDGGKVDSIGCVEELEGKKIKEVVCGYSHTLALGEDGVVWAWGDNEYGQLAQVFGHFFFWEMK